MSSIPMLPSTGWSPIYPWTHWWHSREHPLVLYVFSGQSNIQNLFTEQTRSGSISMNDTIMFYGGKHTLPILKENAETKHNYFVGYLILVLIVNLV